MYSGDKVGQPKLRPTILEFALRAPWLPSQSKIHRQPAVYLDIVLNVETREGVAVILEFSCALPEGGVAAIVSQLSCHQISEPVEAKLSRLEELVVQIDAAALERSAVMQLMLGNDPAYVIAPSEIVAHKRCRRVISEAKSTIDPDLLNCLYGLIGQGYSQIGNADRVGGRATTCLLARKAKASIVQQVWIKDVTLVQQNVL